MCERAVSTDPHLEATPGLALEINTPRPGRLTCRRWGPGPGWGGRPPPRSVAVSTRPAAHLALGSEAAIVFLPADRVGRFWAPLPVPHPLLFGTSFPGPLLKGNSL